MVIFVGNLSRSVTEEQLRALFEPFGVVNSVRIIKDRLTGQPRGFAFVDMPNQDEAQRAMNDEELKSTEIDGRVISLNEAREQGPRTPRPMGDRRSFGGGNGGGGYRPRRNGSSGGGNGGGGGYSNRY